jgi:hypothetical protein
MAEFKVVCSNGRQTKYSGDDARYDIDGQNAVLVVVDGKGNHLQFSAAVGFPSRTSRSRVHEQPARHLSESLCKAPTCWGQGNGRPRSVVSPSVCGVSPGLSPRHESGGTVEWSAEGMSMTGEQIYLSGRACAGAERFRDQAIPVYYRGRPSFIDQQRVDFAARAAAKTAARAAEQGRSHQ